MLGTASPERTKERGFALFTAIWIVALASVITLAITALVRSYVLTSAAANDSFRLEAAAEAGVTMAVAELLTPDSDSLWPKDGSSREMRFDGYSLTVQIRDTAGLVDLNTASRDVLVLLYRAAGASDALSERLADETVDWRDADHTPTGPGGEAEVRDAGGGSFGPKNALFAAQEEVLQLADFDPRLLDAVLRLSTLHSGLVGVDPNFAPAELLEAMGLPAGRDAAALAASGSERRFLSGSSHRAFVIEVTASNTRGARFVRRATVHINRSGAPPFDVLEWSSPRAQPTTEADT